MIKFFFMDVDGTLTDGKIYMGNDGEIFKAFNIKDGCGIKDILPKLDIIPVIITARNSKIVENRCRDLEITEFYQNVRNKKLKIKEILKNYNEKYNKNYTLKNVAYVGDDLIDLECMMEIKNCGGFIACPQDACKEIKKIADYVSSANGGNGAVREIIESLLEKEKLWKKTANKVYNIGI